MSTSKPEKTRQENIEWLPLEEAANRYGYAHKQSISRRLRQLRAYSGENDQQFRAMAITQTGAKRSVKG